MPRKELLVAIRATLVTLVLTGVAYPLLTTGVARALFPGRARGSLVTDEQGRVVGSELIAQPFATAPYLQPRPSAAGEKGYDASASGGSNLGPTSKALRDRAVKDVQRLQQENPDAQAPRVAHARGVAPERVRAVIEANVEGRDLLVLGEPRVNVLLLNLALDRLFGRPPPLAS